MKIKKEKKEYFLEDGRFCSCGKLAYFEEEEEMTGNTLTTWIIPVCPKHGRLKTKYETKKII